MSNSASVSAAFGHAASALAYTAFVLHLLRAGKLSLAGGAARLAFGGALVLSAAWGWVGFAAARLGLAGAGAPLTVLDLARYAAWFGFLLVILRPSPRPGARRAPTAFVLPFVAASLLVGAAFLFVIVDWTAPTIRRYGQFALYGGLALPVFGLILIEQLFRNVAEDLRWNAKPLCLGLACIFVFDLYLASHAILFGRFDADAVGIRGGIHALAVPLLLIAARRESDWASTLQVSRTAAFHSATLLLAGIYLLFISVIGYYVRYFGGQWGSALQLGLLFLALIALSVVVVSGAMRARLRVLLGKHFFSYRYDYRQEWLRFTATLSTRGSPQQMVDGLIHALADMLESPGGAVWTKAPEATEYVQAAHWNMPRSAEREPLDSPFCGFLGRTGWVIAIDEYRAFPDRYDGLVIPAWVVALPQAWLLVPLLVGNELIGFVVLAKPRTAVDVNWEVLDLLKTASRQAASFLAQMQATEALLEVRKFDAFNRMSAFVVHDLKNIVTQLSLMMKNAKRLHANPEFQQDMLMTVENALEKMNQLMLQLREGQAPPGGTSGVDLAPIVRHVEGMASGRGRALEVEMSGRVVTRGHEQRIERVIGHMVQNALDATSAADRVWMKVERAAGRVKVEVGDTGRGMAPDFVRDRLFKPFQTTKEAGMGIGAYESYQYVRELGGDIAVDSELGRGTTITLSLPLFESGQESDLHPSDAR